MPTKMPAALCQKLAALEAKVATLAAFIEGLPGPGPAIGAASDRAKIIQILTSVGRYHGVSPAKMLSADRREPIVNCRHMAMHIAREVTACPYYFIAHIFKRDHGTVMNACSRTRDRIATEPLAAAEAKFWLTQFSQTSPTSPPGQPLSPQQSINPQIQKSNPKI